MKKEKPLTRNDHNKNEWSNSWNTMSYKGMWKEMVVIREHLVIWKGEYLSYYQVNEKKEIRCGHLIFIDVGYFIKAFNLEYCFPTPIVKIKT